MNSGQYEWQKSLKMTGSQSQFKSAFGKALQICSAVSVKPKIRNKTAKVWLDVINGLAVDIFSGAVCIGHCISYIYPMKRRTVWEWFCSPINIHTMADDEFEQESVAFALEESCKSLVEECLTTDEIDFPMRVARKQTLLVISRCAVPAMCSLTATKCA